MPAGTFRHRNIGTSFLVALVAALVLLLNIAARRATADVSKLPRRHWEDTAVAVGLFAGQPGAQRLGLETGEGGDLYRWMRKRLIRTARIAGIRPWEFLRRVSHGAYPRDRILVGRPTDDTGRARLAAIGFRLIGGVSPFLVTWIGPLLTIPVFLWVALELAWSARTLTAAIVLLLVAVSGFFVDVISLSYSAAGFSALAVLAVVPLAVYTVLHPSPSIEGWLTRSLLAGVILAICVLCRSGAALVGAGFVITATVGVRRLAHSWPRRLVVGCGAIALVALPLLLVRPASRHETWLGLWEGLGDFDRSKGHVFDDVVAKTVLQNAGIGIDRKQLISSVGRPVLEPFFRERVVASIGSDPVWYLQILAKRLGATAAQSKLLPSRAETGSSYAPRSHPQQGHTDAYYNMTATADVFVVGRHEWEAPLWLLWLPLLTLIVGGIGFVPSWRPELGVLGIVAAAALAQPVLVTTAGAHETQAFVLVYILAAGFVAPPTSASVGRLLGRS